jgi:hypothetical protein
MGKLKNDFGDTANASGAAKSLNDPWNIEN